MAALRVSEKRACARELLTITACSPPTGSGTSCVYWTSPEACTNAARLMIGFVTGKSSGYSMHSCVPDDSGRS